MLLLWFITHISLPFSKQSLWLWSSALNFAGQNFCRLPAVDFSQDNHLEIAKQLSIWQRVKTTGGLEADGQP